MAGKPAKRGAALARYGEWPNLAAMMFARAREWPERPMLRWHATGAAGPAWHSMTWGAFGRAAASAARRLRAAGIAAGDRVVIVSENRPEFPIAETALMAIRAVPVPTYTTNTVADHAHVLRDCGARVAIVSTAALADRVARGGPARPAGHDGALRRGMAFPSCPGANWSPRTGRSTTSPPRPAR